MIDHELRRELSQDLRRLVTGRITNDAFDDLYFGRYGRSSDRAVNEIAEFGWGLYSSDLLWPYSLRGRHATSKANRRAAARSVLFLRSGLEYDWPREPSSAMHCLIGALAFNLGLPGGIALLICSVPFLIGGVEDVDFLWPVAGLGLANTILSGWYLSGGGDRTRFQSLAFQNWLRAGDFDVWPFLRREDFYEARRTAPLLGAGCTC
jgi:hypothetical protein